MMCAYQLPILRQYHKIRQVAVATKDEIEFSCRQCGPDHDEGTACLSQEVNR